MTLRTSALVAGVLGVILLAVGLYADSQRAETTVVATTSLDTPVVVLEPQVAAIEGATRIAVEGQGVIEVHTARPVDAQAWVASRTVTYVTGVAEWEVLSTRIAERIVASPSPSADPSASPDPSASASPSPTPSPSPSPSASPEPSETEADALDDSSRDHWRSTWRGTDRVSVAIAAISPGETVVVTAVDGSALTIIEMTLERTTKEGWITPLILWGGFLTVLGLVALIFTLIDVRPWQRKGEEWMQRRAKADAGVSSAPEGSRRARRAGGTQIPAVSLEDTESPGPKELSAAPDSSETTKEDKS